MNTKKDILILYALLLIEFLILLNSKDVINSVINSSNIFIIKVLPSLMPTMIIGLCLIKYNVTKIIPNFIYKLFNHLFNFNNTTTSIFIMSMIAGTPSNAIFINDYLNKGLISEKEASNLLCITHFINPLFIIGGVGIGIFNSAKIGLMLLLLMYISNFIKAFILRNNFNSNYNKITLSKSSSFIEVFKESIISSIKSLLIIFGIITMFNILITLLSSIFNFNIYIKCIINGLLEMTSGTIFLKYINISFPIKFILSYLFLSFGGLCIQMQTFSMIKKIKIRYFKYLIFRLF